MTNISSKKIPQCLRDGCNYGDLTAEQKAEVDSYFGFSSMQYRTEEIVDRLGNRTLRIYFKNNDACVDICFIRKTKTVYVDLRDTDNLDESYGAVTGEFEEVF